MLAKCVQYNFARQNSIIIVVSPLTCLIQLLLIHMCAIYTEAIAAQKRYSHVFINSCLVSHEVHRVSSLKISLIIGATVMLAKERLLRAAASLPQARQMGVTGSPIESPTLVAIFA